MLQEYCPARRRMKRSVATTIAQAYGKIHPDLIDRHEMETFLRFDLNRDGLISLEVVRFPNPHYVVTFKSVGESD